MRRIAPLFVMGVLLVAACTEDDEDTTTAATEPGAEAPASAEAPAGDPAPEGIEGVVAVEVDSRDHTRDPVEYPTYPPLGGNHFPTWHDCGFYPERILDEAAVHSLEHGAVWIAYGDETSEEDLEFLRGLAEDETHILVSYYPGLRVPFVVTAWGRQLDLDALDDPRLGRFLEAYLRSGVAPEAGAGCSDGLRPES